MKKALLFLWQLPQNLLGFIVMAFCTIMREECYHDARVIVVKRIRTDCGLGGVILVREKADGYISPITLAHEYGHCIQSRRLGWLYLPSVGLVSSVRNILGLYRKKGGNHNAYFNAWPENQADKLGGVKRKGSGIRYV